jgi:putative effector of murein hydrolase
MNDFFVNSVFFGVFLSLSAYGIGVVCKKKLKLAIFNPILIAVVLTVAVLLVCKIDYNVYYKGAQLLGYLLTPATVCLAVPLYEQIEQLKRNCHAIALGIGAGVLASMISILGMVLLLGMNHQAYVTLLPKSITTAIGMGVSEELGGNVPITIFLIIITGITGNICAEKFLSIIKVKHPIAKGISIGSASHVIGTAKAMEMGQTEGAMSSLSIVTSGILTVVMASLFALLA